MQRMTLRPGTTLSRFAFGALATLLVLAGAAPAWAQGARGQLVVLGLRAPNGEDEAAANVTNALRRAARNAGFQVPDNSPSLEQEIATYSCDDSVPLDCLAQIANELHTNRIIYGTVRRRGRGAQAQDIIEISLYARPETGGPGTTQAAEPVEVARPTAVDLEPMIRTSRRIIDSLLPPPVEVNPVVSNTQRPSESPTPTPARPFPIRRVLGIGIGAVGLGLAVFGVINAVQWFTYESSVSGDPSDRNYPWTFYQPREGNMPTGAFLSNGGAVCAAAGQNHSNYNPAATNTNDWNSEQVLRVCDQARTLSAMAWSFSAIGAVAIGVGLALIVTDNSGTEPAAPPSNRALREQMRRPQLGFTPILTPQLQAASLELRF